MNILEQITQLPEHEPLALTKGDAINSPDNTNQADEQQQISLNNEQSSDEIDDAGVLCL